MSVGRRSSDTTPVADRRFFDIFMPREIKLMQHQVSQATGSLPDRYLGLFLIRFEPVDVDAPSAQDLDVSAQTRHLMRLITSTIRYTDIPGQLNPYEFMAVIREIKPHRALMIAKRLLGMASRSRLLSVSSVALRLGYVVYPLSLEPDFSPTRWPQLLELTQRLSYLPEQSNKPELFGYGLVRGPGMGSPTIPEADLVNLAMTDLDSLTKAELLTLESIELES